MEIGGSNGAILADGDSVQLIKDIQVKGSSLKLKRGDVIKNIRLADHEEKGVECRIGGSTISIRPEFLKKRSSL